MENQIRAGNESTDAKVFLPAAPAKIEKFSSAELTHLHRELTRGMLDSWQAADVAVSFLAGHGYGASSDQLRAAIGRMELSHCSLECLQAELERVAFIQ